MKLLLKDGKVINPVNKTITVQDILIAGGKVAAMGKELAASLNTGHDGSTGSPGFRPGGTGFQTVVDHNEETSKNTCPPIFVINVKDKYVVPGLIDMHVHLREPGFEEKETIATGAQAAARGGFTSIVCMPNTEPPADNQAVISYIQQTAQKTGVVNVFPAGTITQGRAGKELSEMASLAEQGAVAFSDDGAPVVNANLMRHAMEYAKMLNLPVISHCEEPALAYGGVMHEGFRSTMLGLPGMPAAAEEVMVARDIILAGLTGCHLHIAHVSTAGSVELVRAAKEKGIKVTCEVTPHHFTLTDEAVSSYDPHTKVNPPLRSKADVTALQAGLKDGTIDVIATDHAPHTPEEKELEFELAPFGMVGLETAVGLVWTKLVIPGILTACEAVAKMTVNPARILNLKKGLIEVGGEADITVIDPDLAWAVKPEEFASKGRNTPFSGWSLKGLPVVTMVGGRVKWMKLDK